MDLTTLLHSLNIENPSEFEYFEQYAEIAETEEDMPCEVLVEFFRDVDAGALRELTEAYFEDILPSVSDEQTDFYFLLTSIGKVFTGLAGAVSGYESRRAYAEEFYKFRKWYVGTDNVTYYTNDDSDKIAVTVLEALALARAENIGKSDSEAEYIYDFSEALDYEIEEYMMSVNELADVEDDNEEDEEDSGYY